MSNEQRAMSKVERFEDLIAWQRAKELARLTYQVTQQSTFARDFGLTGQMQRAAVSIMSNIAEGYERGSRADFHRFLTMAKASCAEVRSLMYLANEIGYLDQPTFEHLMACANEVARIVGGLRVTIGQQREKQRLG
ncbi:MAG: four helix bundle protein [Thermomicrobiales bacterium]